MTPAVRAAREGGFLTALPMFSRLSSAGLVWPDGTQRSVDKPRLHLTGYADWSGPASATLIGAGRAARDTARVVVAQVRG